MDIKNNLKKTKDTPEILDDMYQEICRHNAFNEQEERKRTEMLQKSLVGLDMIIRLMGTALAEK